MAGQTNTVSNKYLFSGYEEYLEKLGNLEERRFRSIRIICGRRSVFCISLEGILKANNWKLWKSRHYINLRKTSTARHYYDASRENYFNYHRLLEFNSISGGVQFQGKYH